MALKTRPPADFSAAAQIIQADRREDGAYLRSTVAAGRTAGKGPWDWYRKIGEVHYAISRSARIAGYAKLQAVRFAPDGEVEEEIESGLAADIVAGIYSAYGGTRGLIERYYTLLKVPGDSYLLDLDDNGYHFASPDELDVTSFSRWNRSSGIQGIKLTTVPGAQGDDEKSQPFTKKIEPRQLVGRVWSPSKRWVDVPESALHSLETECEALYDLTLSIKAQLRSRFAIAGILFLPPGVSMARSAKGKARVAGQLTEDTLNLILAAMTKNVKTYDDATTLLPIILKGQNADDGDKIKHIILDRSVFETDLTLRAELINRILQSLDSNQDATKGTSESSHWQTWMAADDERRVSVGPDLESLCWALTRLVLHRQLLSRKNHGYGDDIGNIGVWYDLSRAAARSNQQEDARQAWDRVLIGDKPARKLSGIPERDKPDDDEYVRGVGRLVKNPYMMMWGKPEFDTIDWEMVKATGVSRGPARSSPAETPESGPGEGDPGSPDDRETDTPRTQRPA